jgi:hypothetical protein
MRTVTRRISKLEDCVWPAAGKPVLLLVLCQAGWGLALDQDRCIEILGESEFLPTDPVGLVNLLDVPEGLNAKFNPTNQRNNKLYSSCSTSIRSLRIEYRACNSSARNSRSGAIDGLPAFAYISSNRPLIDSSAASTIALTGRNGCFSGTRSSSDPYRNISDS